MEAGAVISIVELCLNAFEGCVTGIDLLSKARGYKRDVNGMHLMLRINLWRLNVLGNSIGLLKEPPVLLLDAEGTSIVQDALEQLKSLVTDVNRLRKEYGIEVETSQNPPEQDESETTLKKIGFQEEALVRLRKLLGKGRHSWQVATWVTYNRQKAQQLLVQIENYIGPLEILLKSSQTELVNNVRAVTRTSNDESELKMIASGKGPASHGTVAPAAELKLNGILLEIFDDSDFKPRSRPAPSTPRTSASSLASSSHPARSEEKVRKEINMELSLAHLAIKLGKQRDNRLITQYKGDPVLLEFKNEAGQQPAKVLERVQKVSNFLSGLDNTFHGLACRGFIKLDHRYAYVFNLPSSKTSLSFLTLRAVLSDSEMPIMPSINARLSFALKVLETLQQLQTAAWLHKELRSDNVLFFLDSARKKAEFVTAPMYITGYTLARADRLGEFTELPPEEREANLYRHYKCLELPHPPYRTTFDMFSVGCILLEIGLWRTLASLLQEVAVSLPSTGKDNMDPDLVAIRKKTFFTWTTQATRTDQSLPRNANESAVFQKLEAAMGKAYTTVVSNLLHAPENEESLSGSSQNAKGAYEGTLGVTTAALATLQSIEAVM